jgi:hypothetical protein
MSLQADPDVNRYEVLVDGEKKIFGGTSAVGLLFQPCALLQVSCPG